MAGKYLIVEAEESSSFKRPFFTSLLIVVLGICLIYASDLLDAWRLGSLVSKAGEAILIAGVLAFAVDQFLKRELLADAARGLFVHMLGFDQQPEVKKRIADIAFGTKLFISKKQIICSITKAPVLGKVDMRVRMHWTIQNPTSESLPYNYGLAWERAERPTQATLGMILGRFKSTR